MISPHKTFYPVMATLDPDARLVPPVSFERDHFQGPRNAPVQMVEFGDYQCPYCGQAYAIINRVQEVLDEYGLVCFTFRNFPLTQIHPNAQHAAEAAEAAGAQGKFWEMHDILYENQHALDDASLREYAAMIGLDVEMFDNEMLTHIHARRVREDFVSGIRSGVNGTPTFFLNGFRYNDSWDEKSLLAAIKQLANMSKKRKP